MILDQERTRRSLLVVASHRVDAKDHNKSDHSRRNAYDQMHSFLGTIKAHYQESHKKGDKAVKKCDYHGYDRRSRACNLRPTEDGIRQAVHDCQFTAADIQQQLKVVCYLGYDLERLPIG